MQPRGKNKTEPQFLSGWKDIATYLNKGVRTVQRYEREFGLPVRRPAGRPRGSVVATRAELDAWVSASPIREALVLSPRPVGVSDFAFERIKRIKQSMEEMGRLRDQMSALRTDLRATVQLVRDSINELERGVLRNSQFDATLSGVSMRGMALERAKNNVVTIRAGKRKIS